ncbi:MAG: glycosyltransferase family 9 protein [Bacteroidales bacterium]
MEKILIIQTAFPGDAILTLPLIQKTKYLFPESQIEIIAIPATKGIFEASPFVKKVIVLDKRNEHKSLFSLIKFGMKLRNYYDRVICPHRSLR